MNASFLSARGLAMAFTLVLLVHGAALAGDGKPFLMKVGTGSTYTPLPAATGYHQVLSVSITPKKSGLCAVTASGLVPDLVSVFVSLATTPDVAGPFLQADEAASETTGIAMTQAFVVTKGTPVTFYLNAQNNDVAEVTFQGTRIWVICESEKVPVLS